MSTTIRQAQASDLPYLYDICRLTGLSGADATASMGDPHLLGQLFAAPYYFYDPRFCLVAADGRPLGYLVGTADTAAYTRWYATTWLPRLRLLYPASVEPVSDFERWALGELAKAPDLPHFLPDYPAHLHIDLLPSLQGQGMGRRLIEEFCRILNADGVKGVHLCVARNNPAAIAFYQKTGFAPLAELPAAIYMGRSLA